MSFDVSQLPSQPFGCHRNQPRNHSDLHPQEVEILAPGCLGTSEDVGALLEENSIGILSWESNIIPLMEEILHQLIGSVSRYLQGFINSRWLFGISSINSSITSLGKHGLKKALRDDCWLRIP